MRLACVALTRAGAAAAAQLENSQGTVDRYVPAKMAAPEDGALVYPEPARELLARLFPHYDGFVLFMAVGAAVRLIAPLLGDKRSDPAVVVVDEATRFAVSVLSGHRGGANALATAVAATLGATPVITTASDARGLPALDLLGQDAGWRLEADSVALRRAAAALVNGEPIAIYQDAGDAGWQEALPEGQVISCPDLATIERAGLSAGATIFVTDRALGDLPDRLPGPVLLYRPPTLVAGIGCVRGTRADEIESLLEAALTEAAVTGAALASLATIDLKRDETGITAVAQRRGLPVQYFSATQLEAVRAPNPSPVVAAAVGTAGVCEPAALLAAQASELLLPKRKSARVTVALARNNGVAP